MPSYVRKKGQNMATQGAENKWPFEFLYDLFQGSWNVVEEGPENYKNQKIQSGQWNRLLDSMQSLK